MRKGTLALAALTAMLAAPAAAAGTGSAADADRATQRGTQFTITFKLQSRGGDPVAIKRFRFRRITAVCNGGSTVRTRGYIPHIRVKRDNTFGHTLKRNGKKVRVAGRVKRDLSAVKGTIRVTGRFAGQTGCNTGLQRWRAN